MGPRIKLITIYNDYEERAGGITYYDTPPLEDEQIRNIIIEKSQIPANQAGRWAELCDGSPRVAHCHRLEFGESPRGFAQTSRYSRYMGTLYRRRGCPK